jgi:Uma2 family endonuclease
MSTGVKILPHYTYEAYCQWEGRWELIEGIPYAISPAPPPRHQAVSGNLYAMFRAALKTGNCLCKAYLPIDYKISEDTILQPDVLIVCKPVEKAWLDFPPALVVEILSRSTAMKDRNNKFYQYEAQGIPYYLIIDTDQSAIEVYRLDEEGHYQPEKTDPSLLHTFVLTETCRISCMLSEIWE